MGLLDFFGDPSDDQRQQLSAGLLNFGKAIATPNANIAQALAAGVEGARGYENTMYARMGKKLELQKLMQELQKGQFTNSIIQQALAGDGSDGMTPAPAAPQPATPQPQLIGKQFTDSAGHTADSFGAMGGADSTTTGGLSKGVGGGNMLLPKTEPLTKGLLVPPPEQPNTRGLLYGPPPAPSAVPAAAPVAARPRFGLNTLQALAFADPALANSLFTMYKYQTDGVEQKPGSYYKNPTTGQITYIPDPKNGFNFDPNTGQMTDLPGYLQFKGAEKAATTRVEEASNMRLKGADSAYNLLGKGMRYNGATNQFEEIPGFGAISANNEGLKAGAVKSAELPAVLSAQNNQGENSRALQLQGNGLQRNGNGVEQIPGYSPAMAATEADKANALLPSQTALDRARTQNGIDADMAKNGRYFNQQTMRWEIMPGYNDTVASTEAAKAAALLPSQQVNKELDAQLDMLKRGFVFNPRNNKYEVAQGYSEANSQISGDSAAAVKAAELPYASQLQSQAAHHALTNEFATRGMVVNPDGSMSPIKNFGNINAQNKGAEAAAVSSGNLPAQVQLKQVDLNNDLTRQLNSQGLQRNPDNTVSPTAGYASGVASIAAAKEGAVANAQVPAKIALEKQQQLNKPLTDGQGKALGRYGRMMEASTILNKLDQKVNAFAADNLPNYLQTGEGQLYNQQQGVWLEPFSRDASGALISDNELARFKENSFPKFGDSPATIALKREFRAWAEKGILAQTGMDARTANAKWDSLDKPTQSPQQASTLPPDLEQKAQALFMKAQASGKSVPIEFIRSHLQKPNQQ